MLKFLRETLSIGDFVEVETSTGLVRGSILEIPPDCLVMLTDGELHEYSEEQLLSIKYFSDDHDAYRDCYIQKFIPEEKSERCFWTENHNGSSFCTNFDNIITIFMGWNMRFQRGHLDLPDLIDVEDEYYNIEVLSNDCDDCFSDYITSVKLPKRLKIIEPLFIGRIFLQKIYVPDTLVYSGGYKIGGCTTCQVFDLNGKLLDWEFEEDW